MSQKCHGCAGSGPYIAPEEFNRQEYDAELIDVWAIGVILYVSLCALTYISWVMNFNSLPWSSAQQKDPHYKYYLDHFRHFSPLDSKVSVTHDVRNLFYDMLTPDPESRVSIAGIEKLDWFKKINVCVVDGIVDHSNHDHGGITCK